jgi:hypothetical protein
MIKKSNSLLTIVFFFVVTIPRLCQAYNPIEESDLRYDIETSVLWDSGFKRTITTTDVADNYGGAEEVPSIIRTFPNDGDNNVVKNSNVYLYFNVRIDENTLNDNNIILKFGNMAIPWEGEYTDNGDEHRFTMDPENYFPGSSIITLTITDGVTGVNGTPLDTDDDGLPGGANRVSDFYTNTSFDTYAPSISDENAFPNPFGSAHEITITALISDGGDAGSSIIIKSQSYVGDTVESGGTFTVEPKDGDFDEEAENITISIPVSDLPTGDEINLKIIAGDSAGNESEPVIVTLYRGAADFLGNNSVFAYPNPCYGDTVRFYFFVTENADATVQIFDLKSRLLGEISGRARASDPDNHLE